MAGEPIRITLLGDISDLAQSMGRASTEVTQLGNELTGALSEAGREADALGGAVADGLENAGGKVSGFGKKLAGIAAMAGAGIAAGLTAGIAEAMDREKGNDLLAAQVGATPEQAKTLGQTAGKIFSSGLGESMGEVNEGLKALWQQGLVPAGATADEISGIGSKLLNVSKIMGEDLGPTANAAGQMVKNGLVKNYDEAMDLLVRGTQVGINKSEDFLDTMNEYSTQFRKIGMDGPTAIGLMNQALKAGARDADTAADAVKEFTLKSIDGSKEAAAAYESLGLNGDKMIKALAGGGPKAAEATKQIFDAMHKLKDPVELNTVSLGLFGTKAEDLGGALNAMDPTTAVASLGQVAGAADKAGNTMNDNASTKLSAFWRTLQTGAVDVIGGKVIPKLEALGTKFAPVGAAAKEWITEKAVPAAQALGDKLAPVASAAKTFLLDTVVPAVQATGEAFVGAVRFVDDNKGVFLVVAGIITVVLLPAIVAWGVQSTISAGANVLAWITSTATASGSAATQVLAHWAVIGGWLKAGAQAVLSGAVIVGQWLLMAGAAIANAAIVAGGWLLMGTQALIQAARMAAAWVIAMGPVGWITATIVALALLIWTQWDNVKKWTGEAWQWVWDKIVGVFNFLAELFLNFTGPGLLIKHWDTIKQATAQAFQWVADKARDGLQAVIDFFVGLPRRIGETAGAMGRAALGIGKTLIDGLGNGLSKLGGFAADFGRVITSATKGAINTVIDLLNWAIPDRLGWGPLAIDLPKNPIPKIRAAGGPASGLVRVGERGPEWLSLPKGSSVIPNHATPASGGGVVVNVNSTADPFAIGREVAWAMRTATR
ncbi:phage tail tape measure protein [Streptomyces sp. NPDC001404]|uniref:phage tail tape measure protein n=1 Tax=Streptomyces sp. NPDC001404 TaxID=3364571 RepID=UPI0036CD2A3C